MNSDVLIIGGGVIGLCVARELRKRGIRKITIIEKGRLGREASWAAAGMLAPQAEADCVDDLYRFCAAARDVYPEFAGELKFETEIDIELDRSGTLYLGLNDGDAAEIHRRFEWQRSAGLYVEYLRGTECRSLEPAVSERVLEGLLFSGDWQVENRKLLAALIEFAQRNNIEVIEGSAVQAIIPNEGAAIDVLTTAGERFSAGHVILATGAWTSLIKIGEVPVPIDVKPIRGQMISFGQTGLRFERVICGPRGYIVPRADGRILAGATVENVGFDTTNTDTGINALRKAAEEIAPLLANFEVGERWAGLRPFAADGLPVIGKLRAAENLVVATAHYRNGILLAPLTATLVSDLVLERGETGFLSSFSPQRFRAAGSGI